MAYSKKIVTEEYTTTTKCETLEELSVSESDLLESRIDSNMEFDQIISYIEAAALCKDLDFILLLYDQKNLPQTMKIIRNNNDDDVNLVLKKSICQLKLKF